MVKMAKHSPLGHLETVGSRLERMKRLASTAISRDFCAETRFLQETGFGSLCEVKKKSRRSFLGVAQSPKPRPTGQAEYTAAPPVCIAKNKNSEKIFTLVIRHWSFADDLSRRLPSVPVPVPVPPAPSPRNRERDREREREGNGRDEDFKATRRREYRWHSAARYFQGNAGVGRQLPHFLCARNVRPTPHGRVGGRGSLSVRKSASARRRR